MNEFIQQDASIVWWMFEIGSTILVISLLNEKISTVSRLYSVAQKELFGRAGTYESPYISPDLEKNWHWSRETCTKYEGSQREVFQNNHHAVSFYDVLLLGQVQAVMWVSVLFLLR